ncbi:MAG: type II toxin-antitoxin system VapB family antitoxin [Bacteroidetes bacterium]|nr:MAG: type II toxin-antitoxin system VapB family antitoxin [Bacteroidota bacterium]
MRTNVFVDDQLLAEAMALSKLPSKRELIQKALESYVRRLKMQQFIELKGKVSWEGNLDEMRQSGNEQIPV